jgi:hypothetical protein
MDLQGIGIDQTVLEHSFIAMSRPIKACGVPDANLLLNPGLLTCVYKMVS